MKIIGIDPAPAKKTVIYDGEKFIEISAIELKKGYLDKVKADTLICWDSPLTGGMPENFEDSYNPFYQRKIELLINRIMPKIEGISTLPYAGCSHWAITQHCFGFPLINDEFKLMKQIPFKLIFNQDEQDKPFEGKYIVEVHPALALWLWLKDNVKDWNYKGGTGNKKRTSAQKKQIIKEIITELNEKLSFDIPFDIEKDDYLDAYIAWKLGDLWLNKQDEVILVGNNNTGAMLLPNVDDAITLQENLEKYK